MSESSDLVVTLVFLYRTSKRHQEVKSPPGTAEPMVKELGAVLAKVLDQQ